ncbi:MAG: SEC-C domain-containing protein [Planctomycetes bacterium]|nr:SEC-C domain-containing protein [Planctomycetota bacterium]
MPGRLRRNDPLARHVPDVLRAYFAHLETDQVVPHLFEIRQALEGTIDEFLETVRTGENVHHHHPKQDPVVHQAPKTGRNDPCPCGSGKKFKKCHGKAE